MGAVQGKPDHLSGHWLNINWLFNLCLLDEQCQQIRGKGLYLACLVGDRNSRNRNGQDVCHKSNLSLNLHVFAGAVNYQVELALNRMHESKQCHQAMNELLRDEETINSTYAKPLSLA